MIEIRREDFSVDEITKKMKDAKIGALSIYLGTVREFPQGLGLEFEDDNRAVRKLEEIEKRAINRFEVNHVTIIHRVGFLGISENILLVAVISSSFRLAQRASFRCLQKHNRRHKKLPQILGKRSIEIEILATARDGKNGFPRAARYSYETPPVTSTSSLTNPAIKQVNTY